MGIGPVCAWTSDHSKWNQLTPCACLMAHSASQKTLQRLWLSRRHSHSILASMAPFRKPPGPRVSSPGAPFPRMAPTQTMLVCTRVLTCIPSLNLNLWKGPWSPADLATCLAWTQPFSLACGSRTALLRSGLALSPEKLQDGVLPKGCRAVGKQASDMAAEAALGRGKPGLPPGSSVILYSGHGPWLGPSSQSGGTSKAESRVWESEPDWSTPSLSI